MIPWWAILLIIVLVVVLCVWLVWKYRHPKRSTYFENDGKIYVRDLDNIIHTIPSEQPSIYVFDPNNTNPTYVEVDPNWLSHHANETFKRGLGMKRTKQATIYFSGDNKAYGTVEQRPPMVGNSALQLDGWTIEPRKRVIINGREFDRDHVARELSQYGVTLSRFHQPVN